MCQGLEVRGQRHYNYFRDYDSSIGRYLQSDPIGLRAGVSTYGYVGGNPLVLADALGLKPGEQFGSAGDAASDAIDYARTKQPQFLEWGGWILRLPNGCYTYDEPTKGSPGGLRLPRPVPPNAAGNYHTHAQRGGGNAGDEHFSSQDLGFSKQFGPGFLGTPGGDKKGIDQNGNLLPVPGKPKRCNCP